MCVCVCVCVCACVQIVTDNDEQGWEERCDASMTHLLRTSLAKSAREASTVALPLTPLGDTEKLKRHIQIVCERLAKGAKLITRKEPSAKEKSRSKSKSNSKQRAQKKEALPDRPE